LGRRPKRGHLDGLIPILLLKDLTFREGILELLLHLRHPGLMLLANGFFRSQFSGCPFGCCPLLRGILPSFLKLGLEVLDLGGGSYSNVSCILFGLVS
jgi:hypothetical protein